MAACGVDLILNAEVSGTTSTYIGSARILTGSNTYCSFRAMMGPTTAATSTLKVKRFTGGTTIVELTTSGEGLKDVSGSQETIAGVSLVDDWYDFYAYGSSVNGSTLVKGIKVTLY
jgi:hypothetical protein